MKSFLLLSTIVLLMLSAASAENLYPSCGSTETKATAAAGKSTTVVSFQETVSTVYLYCFAYEVTSVHSEGSKDYCATDHQTEYPFRLTLRGTYTNDNGEKVTQDFDIKDYKGGSIDAISVYLPKESSISVEFTNLAANPRCILQVREIHDFRGSKKENPKNALSRPVLVATYPGTIATEDGTRSNFILRYAAPEYVQQASQSEVRLLKFWQNCTSLEPGHMLNRDAQLPSGVTLYDRAELYRSFSTFFEPHHTTTYVMCYRVNSTTDPVALAAVTVYSGNPAYYEIVEGMDEDGRVNIDVPMVAKFHGHDLDTRRDGDRAKLVLDTEECSNGKPAGGVPETTDLGPRDDFGPNTTYTLWPFVVREEGAYKVCYLRAGSAHWTEVPYITDVDAGRRQSTTPAPDEPVPVDPDTKQKCPTAPAHARRAYKSVKLTLRGESLPGDLIPSLAKLLCIPPPSVQIAVATKNAVNKAVVYITISCEDSQCESEERYSYLHYLGIHNKTDLENLGIVAAEGQKSVMAYGNNAGTRSPFKTFLWSVLLLALGGGAVYLFMRYKERREYFNNFNLDDGEVDDVYDMYDLESGNLPAPTTDANHIREDNHYVIHDAVIEMEE